MTSSTMIHGVGIRPAIQNRTTATSSRAPAQSSGTAGTRASTVLRGASTASLATRDLVRRGGDGPHRRGVDTHLGAGLGDLAEHAVLDRAESDDLLARLGIEVRDPLDPVLARGELLPRIAALAQVAGQRARKRVDFARADGHLDCDLAGQLGEPADVGDD